MSELDSKTIVVIGNGPSIRNVNWSVLNDVATIGINGSFKLWMDINWYPTYQYIGRKHPKQWTDGLNKFIATNDCTKVFYNSFRYPEFVGKADNLKGIRFFDYPFTSPDPERWENPFLYDVGIAMNMISRTKGMEFAQKLVENMPENIDNKLNPYGIFKVLMGLEKNIRDSDYIKKDRYIREYTMPESFDRFYYNGGMSGEVACLISYLLGYHKIILIGCDNNFVINKDGTMRQKASYGVDDMFFGKKYNTKEDIECPVCRTTEGLRTAMIQWWEHLASMINMWNLDLRIVNCSPVDNIGAFLHVDPKIFFGTDIYTK